jgi:Rod binding domain-containing protein
MPQEPSSSRAGSGAERLRETARELEGVFLGQLMKAMRSTVGSGGLFKDNMDSQTYRDLFDQEVARNMAHAGGIGLADLVLRDQLLRGADGKSSQLTNTVDRIQRTENTGRKEERGTEDVTQIPGKDTTQVLSTDGR